MQEADTRVQLIDKAIGIIGWNRPGNTSLALDEFDARHVAPIRCFLPDSAPLVEVLESPQVQEVVKAQTENEASSQRLQRQFGRIKLLTPLPVAVAIALSVVVLFIAPHVLAKWLASWLHYDEQWVPHLEAAIRQWLPSLVFIGLVLTPVLAWRYDPAKVYAQWQQRRAAAEALRTQLFLRVFEAHPSGGEHGGEWPLLLKLEYFRRWQLEVQRAYVEKACAYHGGRLAAARCMTWAYWLAFLGWFGVIAAGNLASFDEQGQVWFLPTGRPWVSEALSQLQFSERFDLDRWMLLVGLALGLSSLYLTYRSTIGASARNAARLKEMQETLNKLDDELDAARVAAAGADEAGVRAFVERVHATMSHELADWVRLSDLDLGRHKSKTQSTAAIVGG